MANRLGSRWAEGGNPSGMDLLMKSKHTGLVGNPLDMATVHEALKTPGLTRRKPPEVTKEGYKVIGRNDPFELGAADQAAFEKLGALLTAVDPSDLVGCGCGGSSSSHAGGSSTLSSPTNGARSSSGARPRTLEPHINAVVAARPLSPAKSPLARAAPSAADGSSGAFVDQFPPPPASESAASAHSVGGPPARPQTRMHRKPAPHGRGSKSSLSSIYTAVPTSSFHPGGVPDQRWVSQPQPLRRPDGPIRSPDALVDFGNRFAQSFGPAGPPRPNRAGSVRVRRVALQRSSSASASRPASRASLRQSDSRASMRSEALSYTSSVPSFGDGALSEPRSRGARRSNAPPPEPIVPLIAPVPAPLFAAKGGGGKSTYQHLQPSSSYGSLAKASPAMRQSQATLRLLIAEMMIGMREEHSASMASLHGGQSSGSLF